MFRKKLPMIVLAGVSVLVLLIFYGLILGSRMAERDNSRKKQSLGVRSPMSWVVVDHIN